MYKRQGEDVLVAPALRPGGRVEVYLPESVATSWRRFPDGAVFDGGEFYAFDLGLDEMAVFVPEGVKIPMGPEMEYIANIDQAPEVTQYWPE